MRKVFNLVLLAVAAVFAYLVYQSISEPIAFNDERTKREFAVRAKLEEIRTAQELYRDITGVFAPSFDTLKQVLSTEQFTIINVQGDPDDPNFQGQITYDTIYRPAIDSILALGINLDSLQYVPYGKPGTTFRIQADTIDYQSTTVPVVEVGVQRKEFMGPYASKRFARYDQNYDPNKPMKFGDMNKPNLSGNWE